MANQDSTGGLLDFSQPWELSDVVMVVEKERFHVHRSILSICSPVFSTMFTAQFKEKTAEKVPLPGKKASEIKEMLLVIYPTSAKPINGNNYAFLLDLAKEYMMIKITEKCEIYLTDCLEKQAQSSWPYRASTKLHCLELLNIAQSYGLEKLKTACIGKAKSLSLYELKHHKMYKKISLNNYREIVEGRINTIETELGSKARELTRLESNSKTRMSYISDRASVALKELESITSILVFLACKPAPYCAPSSLDDKIQSINSSGGEFKNLSGPLKVLRDHLQYIQNQTK